MFRKLKYWILRKLLLEICLKSGGCNHCCCDDERYPWSCAKDHCESQARVVWGIKEPYIPF